MRRGTSIANVVTTLDARIAFTKPDSAFLPELSLGVNNLTDARGAATHGQVQVPGKGTYDIYHFIPPRTVMMSLSMKY